MAIPHARAGEVVDVRPLGSAIAETKTKAIVKTKALEVLRIAMVAGKSLPPHKVVGGITVQCLEGKVEFRIGEATHELTAGTLLYVEGGCEHSLHAIENSSLLVTILLMH